jgi:hypothetical protein
MNMRRRLARLESRSERGCQDCRGKKWPAITPYIQDGLNGQPVLASGYERPAACPTCGEWPPTIEIIEMVVHTREEAAAALALNRTQNESDRSQ